MEDIICESDKPASIVNGTFFSFETNQNLNLVIQDGKLLSYNAPEKGKGIDSMKLFPTYRSAIGISRKRKADVAWTKADTSLPYAMAVQVPIFRTGNYFTLNRNTGERRSVKTEDTFSEWEVRTAIGGGPVLLQENEINITNEQEKRFAGKAIYDKSERGRH